MSTTTTTHKKKPPESGKQPAAGSPVVTTAPDLPRPAGAPGAAVTTPPPENLVVVMPGDVCFLLLVRAGLDDYRRAHRGENRRVDEVLVEMTTAAIRWRESLTDHGQNRAPSVDSDASSPLLTTTEAAERAGLSARTVRRAIENGEIPIARRVGRQYVVTADDVELG